METKTRKQPKRDPEMDAIKALERVLGALDEEQRVTVMNFVMRRLEREHIKKAREQQIAIMQQQTAAAEANA